MNKMAQNAMNAEAWEEYQKAMKEVTYGNWVYRRLRRCQAAVLSTNNYWVLRSYNTIVAVTSKDTGICYDVLRLVYGYTATSAQHIAKFRHDYHTAEYKCGAPHWVAR